LKPLAAPQLSDAAGSGVAPDKVKNSVNDARVGSGATLEAMSITTPPPVRRTGSRQSWVSSIGARRFSSSTAFHSARRERELVVSGAPAASVVAEVVGAAERLSLGHQRLDLLVVAQVDQHGPGVSALGAHQSGHPLGCTSIDVSDQDVSSGTSESLCQLTAKACTPRP
jgi:hypothetical protein